MSSLNMHAPFRNLPLLIGGILAGFGLAYMLHVYKIPFANLAPVGLLFVIAALTGLAKTTTA